MKINQLKEGELIYCNSQSEYTRIVRLLIAYGLSPHNCFGTYLYYWINKSTNLTDELWIETTKKIDPNIKDVEYICQVLDRRSIESDKFKIKKVYLSTEIV